MHLNNLLAVSTAAVSFFPLALAAPAPDSFLDLKRWFTLNPSNPGGPQIWSDHKLKYKFQDDDSKNKLGDVVTAGWRIWTDAGVDTANIDIVESSDDDALVIVAVNDAKAQTTVGKTGGARMTFGVGSSYGFLDTNANMAHELGHALGFYHEHQRDDRGDHVVFNCAFFQRLPFITVISECQIANQKKQARIWRTGPKTGKTKASVMIYSQRGVTAGHH